MVFVRHEVVRSFLEDPELSGMQGRLGALLASRAQVSGPREGEVWPSQERLSGWLGIHPRKVRDALSALEALGRIRSRRTPRGNVYTVLPVPSSEDAAERPQDAWLLDVL